MVDLSELPACASPPVLTLPRPPSTPFSNTLPNTGNISQPPILVPTIPRLPSPLVINHPLRKPKPAGLNCLTKLACLLLNHLQLPLAPSKEPHPNFFTTDVHRWIHSMRMPHDSTEVKIVDLDIFSNIKEVQVEIVTFRKENLVAVEYEIEVFATCVDDEQAIIWVPSPAGVTLLELKMVVQWWVDKTRPGAAELAAKMDGMEFAEVLKVLRYVSKWKVDRYGVLRTLEDAEKVRAALDSLWPVDDMKLWGWWEVELTRVRK